MNKYEKLKVEYVEKYNISLEIYNLLELLTNARLEKISVSATLSRKGQGEGRMKRVELPMDKIDLPEFRAVIMKAAMAVDEDLEPLRDRLEKVEELLSVI